MITTTPPLARGNTSNDQLRRYNLSMVMTMIHQAGGCTRAELTRRTGLNRSTIAGLVAELVELEMAVEGAPAPDPVAARGAPVNPLRLHQTLRHPARPRDPIQGRHRR